MDFRQFLKMYSPLSNEFIDDFYNIYDYNESNTDDFIIELEIIAKWLDTRKRKLKETLIKSYTKDKDYIISKTIKKEKISKSNKELILLTPDCFKRLCLLSRTDKAEEVRTYFLELEKLINNYKNFIIDGLKQTVNILENNQKETAPKNIKGVVYILKSPKDINGIYRFGQTEDFAKRLINYNSAHSDKMEIVYIYETRDMKKIESCVLAQIKELRYRKRKDFYEIDVNLLKKIIGSCSDLTLKYKKKIGTSKRTNKRTIQVGGAKEPNFYLYINKVINIT